MRNHRVLKLVFAATLCSLSLSATPIVVENKQVFIDTGSPTSATIANFAVSEGNDRKLVVVASWEGAAGRDITSLTYGTQALTNCAHIFSGRASTIWYLDAPTVGTNDINVTFAGALNGVIVGALSLQNAAPGDPVATHQSPGSVATLSIPAANTLTVGVYTENTAGTGVVSPLDNMLYALGGISSFGSAGYQHEPYAGSQTYSWTTPAINQNVVAAAAFAAVPGNSGSGILFMVTAAPSEIPRVTGLSARVRSGQVFLTWDEEPGIDGITYEVYIHSSPITEANLADAEKIGHHIEAGSACDWWLDPASLNAGASPDRSHGFVIDGEELDPTGGLFVHTVLESDPAPMYFAVLPSTATAANVVPGANALTAPVSASVALPAPIQLKAAPAAGSGAGKSLTLSLHGRGGGKDPNDQSNFLVFGDALQGWREGIARKFIVSSDADGIIIEPRDWIWVGRPLLYSSDTRDHALAINTWWYGCNEYIYDENSVTNGLVVNYTEEHLLYLVRWAQQYYGTDPQKTYISGTSMGGSGAISAGFHHPDVFATIYSQVPVVAYTRRAGSDGNSNLWRLDGLCGRICDETVMCSDGIPVMDRMNGERMVLDYPGELPFLVLCNGRNDGSIPWINNPPFYQALNEAKRGFVCYWNDGAHDMWKFVPADVTDFYTAQPLVLTNSYPAFSSFSDNRDPGAGEKDDGDLIGWMNRGLYWTDPVETENAWSVSLMADEAFQPSVMSVDVTPRKLSMFQIVPDETLLVNGSPVQADSNGRLTITGLVITNGTPLHLQVERLP